jgi:hypothetical protein
MSLPCLNFYRDWFLSLWFQGSSEDIGKHLTSLGLAHWFAQDGSKTADNGVYFATHCFSDNPSGLGLEGPGLRPVETAA